jgi:hypothetical protein
VPYSNTSLDIVLADRFSVSLPPGAKVTDSVSAPAAARPPVAGEQELGRVVFQVDGKKWDERALLADRAIPVASWQSRLRYRLGQFWAKGRAALADSVRRLAEPAVRLPLSF